jgi:hypothetical protein
MAPGGEGPSHDRREDLTLSITPCPSPLPSALRDEQTVEIQRNLFCPNYDGCLHLAVKRGWDGWTCRHCPLLGRREFTPRARDFAESRRRTQSGQD